MITSGGRTDGEHARKVSAVGKAGAAGANTAEFSLAFGEIFGAADGDTDDVNGRVTSTGTGADGSAVRRAVLEQKGEGGCSHFLGSSHFFEEFEGDFDRETEGDSSEG